MGPILHATSDAGSATNKEINILVNFSNTIVKGNDPSDCWICHRQPRNTPTHLPQFQSTCSSQLYLSLRSP